LACGSCNGTKAKKPYAEWLDEQEGAQRPHSDRDPATIKAEIEELLRKSPGA
jgi:hypothetical protein